MGLCETVIQLRNTGTAMMYDRQVERSGYPSSLKARLNMKRAQKKQYSGKVTTGSRKRMARAINNCVQITRSDVWFTNPLTDRFQKQSPCFITLTVPAGYKIGYRQLEDELMIPFLDWLVAEIGKENKYVRKVEYTKQEVPHYHLLVSCFVNHKDVRAKWNYLLRKAGLLDNYAIEKGHFKAPSTEVKAIRKIKNVANYMIKELSKNKQNEKHVPGRVWACSDGLEESYYEIPLSSTAERKLIALRDAGFLNIKTGDYWSTIDAKYDPGGLAPPSLYDELLTTEDREKFEERKEIIRGNKPKPEPFNPYEKFTVIGATVAAPGEWKPVQLDFSF